VPGIAASATYDPGCRRCTRLATFLDDVHAEHPDYWCKPVPPFGDADARLVIVGLAPGMHGANASGRPFTGDFAGIILYETLHRYGFASSSVSTDRHDGLELRNCRITNAVKCLPPQNKPLPAEINACNAYLAADLMQLRAGTVLLALGRIAHGAVLMALGQRKSAFAFTHGARHDVGTLVMFDSYHCSRYNTNTRRLTPAMFDAVFADVTACLGVVQ
jgi:uracil-DNA glycosylase family 4